MSDGRTVWWSKDAAWWERERIVILGEQFGAAGPAIVDWLTCQAKRQHDSGRVRAGYMSVARGTFTESFTARGVISLAVKVGLLDDFEDDGITFRCRISGWTADQEITAGAVRQRRYRERQRRGEEPQIAGGGKPHVANGERVQIADGESLANSDPPDPPTDERYVTSRVTESNSYSTVQDSTEEEHLFVANGSSRAADDHPVAAKLAKRLACHVQRNDPKAKPKPESEKWVRDMRLLLADRDGDIAEVERIIDWSQADHFWRCNVLSPGKLRKQFPQLALKAKPDDVQSHLPVEHRVDDEYSAQLEEHLQAQREQR